MADIPKLVIITGTREELEQRAVSALLRSIVSGGEDRSEFDQLSAMLNRRADLSVVSNEHAETAGTVLATNNEQGETN